MGTRILRSLDELPSSFPFPVLSIGNFDGVHRAHQQLLRRVVRQARARGGTAMALTFDPHPSKVVMPQRPSPMLTTVEQRLAYMEELELDVVVVFPFTGELSRLGPRAFVEQILIRGLGVRKVLVGANFRFGHQQRGDPKILRQLGRELGFEVESIRPVRVAGETVSSSLIRRLVGEGQVAQAARMLGRPLALTGQLQAGAGRGHSLGFPTLNLVPEQECLPARGVYCTETLLEGQIFSSATNVGVRPTFNGNQLLVESHLLNFSGGRAGGRLEVRFYKRLREERKFASPKALVEQIALDVECTRRFFARRERSSIPPRRPLAAAP